MGLCAALSNAHIANGGNPLGGSVTAAASGTTAHFPPCPNCHRLMHETATRTGTEINYPWTGVGADGQPQPQQIAYPGGNATLGDQAPNLAAAYRGSRSEAWDSYLAHRDGRAPP